MREIDAALTDPARRHLPLVEVLGPPGGPPARTLTYAQTHTRRDALAARLLAHGATGRTVGLVAGNTPEWIVADLALLAAGATEVPVPPAFSAEQAAALLRGTTLCVTDRAGAARLAEWGLAEGRTVLRADQEAAGVAGRAGDPGEPPGPDHIVKEAGPRPEHLAAPQAAPGPDHIVKVIHTSGTTGAPKGVRIRGAGLSALLASLAGMVPEGALRRYLSLVPFSLLIEQVAGVYLPVLTGGSVVLLPEDEPLLGTAGARASEVLRRFRTADASAAVLPPAMVSVLDKEAAALAASGQDPVRALFGGPLPPFLMAGGAPVDADALRRLGAAGIEVLEGYGLSENSSVVAWNRPGENAPGTVGRPLPHCEVRLGEENELLVRSSSLFAGYTVEDPTSRPVDAAGWLHTGDRAELDAAGRVRILGRLKNMIITSHGRNVSPEWVEGRLRSCPGVREAVVLGDGMEHLAALILTAPGADPGHVADAVRDFAAQALAETDRPAHIRVAEDTPALRARFFTVTGRPRRDLLAAEPATGLAPSPHHTAQEDHA